MLGQHLSLNKNSLLCSHMTVFRQQTWRGRCLIEHRGEIPSIHTYVRMFPPCPGLGPSEADWGLPEAGLGLPEAGSDLPKAGLSLTVAGLSLTVAGLSLPKAG